jgi:hypothetical protein
MKVFWFYCFQTNFIDCLASGWPNDCTEVGISEEERERRKQSVIDKAFSETGIALDREQMIVNPGMRLLAKLCLNSLWVLIIFWINKFLNFRGVSLCAID